MVPLTRLSGSDLTDEEKKALGLAPQQLAFRQRDPASRLAAAAGIKPGDIILGFDGKEPATDYYGFITYVQRHYIAGDQVMVDLIRDGKRLSLPMTLRALDDR
jgi:serine protease DegQ